MKPYKELLATGALCVGYVMAAYSVFILNNDNILTVGLVALTSMLGGLAGYKLAKKE